MGIKELLQYLKKITGKKIIQTFSISEMKGEKIAFDTPILVYSKKSEAINLQIKGLKDPIYDSPDYEFCRIYAVKRVLDTGFVILEGGCIPVFVFDGTAPDLKKGTKEDRQGKSNTKKNKLAELRRIGDALLTGKEVTPDDVEYIKKCTTKAFEKKYGPVQTVDDLRELIRSILRQFIVVNAEDYLLLGQVFSALGIPHIYAESEAEQTCALMCLRKDVMAIYTTDSDCLVYGCPIMINNIKHIPGARIKIPAIFTCYTFQNALEATGLTHQQFIDFCILCGTDFNNNVPGYGAVKHHDFVRTYGSVKKIMEAREVVKNKNIYDLNRIEKLLIDYEVDYERYQQVRDFFTTPVFYDKSRLVIDVGENHFEESIKELKRVFNEEAMAFITDLCLKITKMLFSVSQNTKEKQNAK